MVDNGLRVVAPGCCAIVLLCYKGCAALYGAAAAAAAAAAAILAVPRVIRCSPAMRWRVSRSAVRVAWAVRKRSWPPFGRPFCRLVCSGIKAVGRPTPTRAPCWGMGIATEPTLMLVVEWCRSPTPHSSSRGNSSTVMGHCTLWRQMESDLHTAGGRPQVYATHGDICHTRGHPGQPQGPPRPHQWRAFSSLCPVCRPLTQI